MFSVCVRDRGRAGVGEEAGSGMDRDSDSQNAR